MGMKHIFYATIYLLASYLYFLRSDYVFTEFSLTIGKQLHRG